MNDTSRSIDLLRMALMILFKLYYFKVIFTLMDLFVSQLRTNQSIVSHEATLFRGCRFIPSWSQIHVSLGLESNP
jgi:hypothetical protein